VVFGELTNPKLSAIQDMDWREVAIFAPLIIGTLWLGVYPKAVFVFTGASVERLIEMWRAGSAAAGLG
jgi:NADH-quinone oxidoreductase subunit M